MQFFEHQDRARENTRLLVILFASAVLILGLMSAAVTHFVLLWGTAPGEALGAFHFQAVACGAIATWGIIFLGSAYKMAELRSGGHSVAESLGGSLLVPNSQVPLERRALNVVEEMALAASLPVPPVYLLRSEQNINAFAAGWSADDAVIGITQGALEHLTRDQLQGVIAHEFSHILHRDCALNMKLLGVLHGVVLISSIGRGIMSMSASSRHTSTKREGGSSQLMIVGGVVWLFGSLGVLSARLIQAAVSKQREYLADAAAVQFTRNPLGIAGALAKIASASSALRSPSAQESGHMLIGQPSTNGFSSILASHPPLFERINRLLPGFSGDFDALANSSSQTTASRSFRAQNNADTAKDEAMLFPSESSSQLSLAAQLLASLDPTLLNASVDPFSARALILAFLLEDNATARVQQLALIEKDQPLYQAWVQLRVPYASLQSAYLLPIFDRTLGTLAALSEPQQHSFARLVQQLRSSLSPDAYRPFCFASLVLRHLKGAPVVEKTSKMLVKTAIETTVGLLALLGNQDEQTARLAFNDGCSTLSERGTTLQFPAVSELNVDSLAAALRTLERLPSSTQKQLLNAAELVAMYDGQLNQREAELLRVMAATLNLACPLAIQPNSSLVHRPAPSRADLDV